MTATAARETGLARPGTDKVEARRVELAESALTTLGELGYAKTSLREIAQNSAFSHGVLHYYFADKTALIVYCVRHYKAQCVHRYDDVIASASSADELIDSFADKLVESIVLEAPMHRLWYDLRSQSMFNPEFRADVEAIDDSLEDMIGRAVLRLGELADVELTIDVGTAYAALDGVFEQGLLDHHNGRTDALERMSDRTRQLLRLFVPQQ